jgi:transposase
MATVNKTSIREEITRLKNDFDHLCNDGKVSAEMRVVMNSLLMVVELILAVFLEKKTRKNSKNSSIPSSQTEKDETAKVDHRTKGRGKKVFGEVKTPPAEARWLQFTAKAGYVDKVDYHSPSILNSSSAT